MGTSRNAWTPAAVLLGVILCSGCAAPSAGAKSNLSTDEQAEALARFSLGLLAENSGDSSAALRHLKAAIHIDPSETVLYPVAVSTALRLDQPDEALRLARQLCSYEPDRLAPRLLEAQVCALSGKTQEAENLFRATAADFPADAESSLSFARFLISRQRKPEAIRILEAAQPVHQNNADLLGLLGTLYIDHARDLTAQPEIERTVLQGIVLLEQAAEIRSDDPQLWQQIGYARLAVKDPEKAKEAFEKAHELQPGNIEIARQLLDISIINRSFDRALDLCEDLARQTGTSPELWLQYIMEQVPEASQSDLAASLERYLKQHPYAPVLYYAQLSALYLDQQKLTEAEAVLHKAQEIYPDNHRIQMVVGYLHLRQERYEEAYSALNQLRIDAPDSDWITPFFTVNFMVAAQKSGRLEEAAEMLASSYTNDPVILTQYMQALLTGQTAVSTQSAIDLLNAFRTLCPEASETLYYLSLLQADQNQYEEALRNARRFETLASDGSNTNLLDAVFYYQYAVLHERTGNLDEAETLFRKAMDMGAPATVASAQNYIAYMWAERGEKLDMALELIQQALQTEPDNPAYIDTLGWIYYMMGHYEKARVQLTLASEQLHDDPLIWEHLGDTYLKLGNVQAAVRQWEKGLEMAPDQHALIQRLEEHKINTDGSPAPEDIP